MLARVAGEAVDVFEVLGSRWLDRKDGLLLLVTVSVVEKCLSRKGGVRSRRNFWKKSENLHHFENSSGRPLNQSHWSSSL